jgi:hypothetical protein
MLGIMIALTPSLIVLALLLWHASVASRRELAPTEFANEGRHSDVRVRRKLQVVRGERHNLVPDPRVLSDVPPVDVTEQSEPR